MGVKLSQQQTTLSLLTPDGFLQELAEEGDFIVSLVCPTCQQRFTRPRTRAREQMRKKRIQYCSRGCRTKGTFRYNEGLREKSRTHMMKLCQERETSWNSGIPWSDAHRAKASEQRKGWKFAQRGGNGTGMSPTEALIAPMMPEGFIWNYIVRSEGFGLGYPSHYKLDFGNPQTMVCLEVDGASHTSRLGQERDARKNERLAFLGWKVCRIKNDKAWSLYSTSRLKEHLHTLLGAS